MCLDTITKSIVLKNDLVIKKVVKDKYINGELKMCSIIHYYHFKNGLNYSIYCLMIYH